MDHSAHPHAAHEGHHGHRHAPEDFGRAFAIGVTLNVGFVGAEAAFGYLGNSMALIADAGHNLSDVLGLLVAWSAATLSKRAPTVRYTYGLRGSSILAALLNAALLLVAVGAIGWEAVLRLADPKPVAEATVMIVAAIGIAVNGATALLFASGRRHDLNIRGAYLHMMADAAVSLGVVIAGALILVTGWLWIDALTSLAIAAVIFAGSYGLLRDSVAMALGAVPRGIDPDAVRRFLERRAGVAKVHDLHIWPISTSEVALTCHLVMPEGAPGDGFLAALAHDLAHEFGIGHVTVQIERDAAACTLAPEEVV